MSWNATVDRLRGQAQQYGLASDYVTAKLLYQAVDEIERIARERDEERARIPNPDDLRDIIEMAEAWVEAGHPHVSGAWVRIARVRSTLPRSREDDRE